MEQRFQLCAAELWTIGRIRPTCRQHQVWPTLRSCHAGSRPPRVAAPKTSRAHGSLRGDAKRAGKKTRKTLRKKTRGLKSRLA